MILVTGGAYQGKSTFIKNQYPESLAEAVDGKSVAFEDILKASCIMSFEAWIRREVEKTPREKWNGLEDELTKKALEIAEKNPDVIIELPEVGLGLVPMDAVDRCVRESIGRMGCALAERACEVYRLVMGQAVRIK